MVRTCKISRAVHPLVMCKLRVVIPAGFWLEPFVSSETLVCICSSQKRRFASSETLVCICSQKPSAMSAGGAKSFVTHARTLASGWFKALAFISTMSLAFNAFNVLDVSLHSTPLEHQLDSRISHILKDAESRKKHAEALRPFALGKSIVIQGLSCHTELNGSLGIVIAWDGRRVEVGITDGWTPVVKTISVRPACLLRSVAPRAPYQRVSATSSAETQWFQPYAPASCPGSEIRCNSSSSAGVSALPRQQFSSSTLFSISPGLARTFSPALLSAWALLCAWRMACSSHSRAFETKLKQKLAKLSVPVELLESVADSSLLDFDLELRGSMCSGGEVVMFITPPTASDNTNCGGDQGEANTTTTTTTSTTTTTPRAFATNRRRTFPSAAAAAAAVTRYHRRVFASSTAHTQHGSVGSELNAPQTAALERTSPSLLHSGSSLGNQAPGSSNDPAPAQQRRIQPMTANKNKGCNAAWQHKRHRYQFCRTFSRHRCATTRAIFEFCPDKRCPNIAPAGENSGIYYFFFQACHFCGIEFCLDCIQTRIEQAKFHEDCMHRIVEVCNDCMIYTELQRPILRHPLANASNMSNASNGPGHDFLAPSPVFEPDEDEDDFIDAGGPGHDFMSPSPVFGPDEDEDDYSGAGGPGHDFMSPSPVFGPDEDEE
jgi:hypothetical protein